MRRQPICRHLGLEILIFMLVREEEGGGEGGEEGGEEAENGVEDEVADGKLMPLLPRVFSLGVFAINNDLHSWGKSCPMKKRRLEL